MMATGRIGVWRNGTQRMAVRGIERSMSRINPTQPMKMWWLCEVLETGTRVLLDDAEIEWLPEERAALEVLG